MRDESKIRNEVFKMIFVETEDEAENIFANGVMFALEWVFGIRTKSPSAYIEWLRARKTDTTNMRSVMGDKSPGQHLDDDVEFLRERTVNRVTVMRDRAATVKSGW